MSQDVANQSLTSRQSPEASDETVKDLVFAGIDPQVIRQAVESFDDLELHESVRRGLEKLGWTKPTPVQRLCLPFTIKGQDVAGFAQTGTGKTGVFVTTITNKLLASTGATGDNGAGSSNPRAVVLVPTRELAMQIEDDAKVLLAEAGLTSLAVFGGVDYDKQARRLRDGVDAVIATPGRLKDYVRKGIVQMDKVDIFVCDEADRMFDMGFIEDVEFFLEKLREDCQRLLFSATTNEQVKELAFEYLENPQYISVTPETLTPEKIDQQAIHCHATAKLRVMLGLLGEHQPACAIIFTNTKLVAEWLHFKLAGNGIDADLITGDLPQKKRIRLIKRIKEGQLKVLIATDVASRGLHISQVTHVYNFDLPDEPANYVHRIGRTARAGAKGTAVSLVCDDYGQNLEPINEMLGDEVSLKSVWYDEAFLKIEDQAGDPFADRYVSRRPARTSERPHPDRQRSDKPRQEGKRRSPTDAKGTRPGASANRRDGAHKGSAHKGSVQKDGNQPGGRSRSRADSHRSTGGGRNRASSMSGSRSTSEQSLRSQTKLKTQMQVVKKGSSIEEQQGKGFAGVIKKMISTLFGKGKS